MERQQLRLPNDTSKYLSQFKYVEAARYRDEEWLSKPGVIRVMEGPKDNRVPKRMDVNSEVEQFADQYNREGIYTSVWQYRNKHAQAGEPYLGSLYFDFDSHSVDIARGEAINLYQYLREYCEDGAVHIYFSGSKGFHIECEPIALGINAGEDLAGLYRSIASDLASNLELSTLDFQVYDIRRMWRLANTRHQSTGLYKRRLTEQILFGGVDLIKEFAEEPGSSDEIPEQSFSAKANEWFREYLYKYEEAQKPTQYSVQDLVNRFNRYGSSTVRIEPNVEKEFDPVALFEGCPAILKHWEAAEKNHHLDHEARLFLCSILTYSEEAIWYLHEILKNCDDYNPDISRAHISDWIRRRENGTGGRPYSCKRANDAGVGCGNCELEPKKKWIKIGDKLVETDEETQPSPIRFAYHNKKGG